MDNGAKRRRQSRKKEKKGSVADSESTGEIPDGYPGGCAAHRIKTCSGFKMLT
jgi:hypothetical protein